MRTTRGKKRGGKGSGLKRKKGKVCVGGRGKSRSCSGFRVKCRKSLFFGKENKILRMLFQKSALFRKKKENPAEKGLACSDLLFRRSADWLGFEKRGRKKEGRRRKKGTKSASFSRHRREEIKKGEKVTQQHISVDISHQFSGRNIYSTEFLHTIR